MKSNGVVLSLAVEDVERSLTFYRIGLGIESAQIVLGIVAVQLPGLTLFLAAGEHFAKYAREARAEPRLPVPTATGFLSCAIQTREEIDEILRSAEAAGGESFEPHVIDHVSGRTQYVGTVKDPDGHLWQFVCNVTPD